MAAVAEPVPARETAVGEVHESDWDEQARDTIHKGWSKDQWLSGVLERAIGIVARSADKDEQAFKLKQNDSDGGKYAVSRDREMNTFYRENKISFAAENFGKYFLTKNLDLEKDGAKIHVQGTQKPDSISMLDLTGNANGITTTFCVCFEGDAHNIDDKDSGGMYLYEKMFQDAALCHDVNAHVPAIFINSVLWRHDPIKFGSFMDWSTQFLKEHVRLIERLLHYIHDKPSSFIFRRLQAIDPGITDTDEFDFYCWINAVRNGPEIVTSDVDECFEGMNDRDSQVHGHEFKSMMEWRTIYYAPGEDWLTKKEKEEETDEVDDGLQHNKFNAKIIKFTDSDIPVLIMAVPRVKQEDVDAVVADKKHECSGMWYPMHIDRYVTQMQAKADATWDNFLVPDNLADQLTFTLPLSDLPFTDSKKNILIETRFNKYKKDIFGHVIFTLPWLWINIGFLCILKRALDYVVSPNAVDTIKLYETFYRKSSSQIHSRQSVKNSMTMFGKGSSSLFAHLCIKRNEDTAFEADIQTFLTQTCGWTNADSASSPAVFFKMIGASNLITAHSFARQLQRKTPLTSKFEDIKATFPLAAQVEIDYAVECLCRHYYFVQDKTIERDGAVSEASFNKMKNSLTAEVKRLKDQLYEMPDRQPDVLQASKNIKRTGAVKAYVCSKNVIALSEDQINFSDLTDKIIAYRIKHQGSFAWYEGRVDSDKGNGMWEVHYADGDVRQEQLSEDTYGTAGKWVVLQRKPA